MSFLIAKVNYVSFRENRMKFFGGFFRRGWLISLSFTALLLEEGNLFQMSNYVRFPLFLIFSKIPCQLDNGPYR